jgi:hypothetical protein
MIQRKQTIYLLFAGLVTLVLLFIPFGYFEIERVACLEYNAFAVKTITEREVIVSTPGNVLLLIVTSLLSFITVFFYKNRKLQLKLISLNMIVILLAVFTILYLYPNFVFPKNPNFYDMTLKYNYIFLICFIPPVGLYLAKKAIAKDEALVRSADRLR